MKYFYKLYAWLTGKNAQNTPVEVIRDQMLERRQLPIGRKEFDEWADRIISSVPPLNAEKDSLKFGLATMILHLGPQESHREDAYFSHSLLKSASNQVAAAVMQELKKAQDAKNAEANKAAAALNPAADATLARADAMKMHIVKPEATPIKDAANDKKTQ